jgi:predicted transcriptional regulator
MTKTPSKLSRRERQILDLLYERQQASAKDIQQSLEDAPSYSTVRALLARMVDKGLAHHHQQGSKYIYSPVTEKGDAGRFALGSIIKTFFEGSASKAANALIGNHQEQLSDSELDALELMIQQARDKNNSNKGNQ